MKRLNAEIIRFFQSQGFIIVSTIDRKGLLHNSCKDIVQINAEGRIYIFDLYRGRTYENLQQDPRISITAVDEHKFKGYCLKGEAKIIKIEELAPEIIRAWEDKITSRVSKRVLKNIRGEKGHPQHPEVLLPQPEYMIVVEAQEVVDLTPHHLRKGV